MTFPFFDTARDEASQRVAFSGNRIDRQAEARTDDAAEQALKARDARLLLFAQGRLFLRVEGDRAFDPYFTRDETPAFAPDLKQAVLLGHENGIPVLAVPSAADIEALPTPVKAIDYRSIYMQGLLEPTALGALAQGAALLAWHESHRFCGRCGNETEMRDGGYKRHCPTCGRDHFPRTDPVVIMLAVRGEQCLLGRSPHFAPGMVSCLAGFVEPGETIEAAVRRETREEAGIAVGAVAYHASQPWPFPYSLMIGCYGQAESEAITMDENELEDCRWFSRDEVRLMLEDRHPDGHRVPPRGAIANRLIRDWVLGSDPGQMDGG
ncbi:NAD(+) diphosphatase [Nitratireductor sp. L1-7-SE]|uniref:NAD(+) diphosphatase n=1 Tax=Nitratireductor rhodophyticola TaxID=2854036 RepID=A0ABS7RA22_9HYPH|nr:NAD(+) diphosphatase [Nitratireductor rhodophyticola]MBY8917257.1 NAD(+) diphosphatase [Nitratireductor rhodophyticola]MBY8920314.1 NAD(+) diphosphatase [Nitratireductor rhodophyticola]